MKYSIKRPTRIDSRIIETNNLIKAIIEALYDCNDDDLWIMSNECSEGDGIYIDAYPGFRDEDGEEVWFNAAFITTVKNGDDYEFYFILANQPEKHTIKRTDIDVNETTWCIDNMDIFNFYGEK